MKYLLVFLMALTGLSAQGAPNPELIKASLESQPNCGRTVRIDDNNLYLGFGSYRRGLEEPRQPIPGKLRIVPFDGSPAFELATKDGAIDVVSEGSTAFVLTYSSIEEWDLLNRSRKAEYSTYAINAPLAYQEHATGFARSGDILIISHGRLGVSFFNLKTKRLVNQFRLLKNQMPLESMATGVTVQGNLAYVLMDNFHLVKPPSPPPFRGLVLVDMKSQTVRSELSGLNPGADAVVSDSKKVLVSYWGRPIWKYAIESLRGKAMPNFESHVWSFPVKGHPTGRPAMDEKYYYTCFLKAPESPGENGGRFTNVPVALDRRQLMLD